MEDPARLVATVDEEMSEGRHHEGRRALSQVALPRAHGVRAALYDQEVRNYLFISFPPVPPINPKIKWTTLSNRFGTKKAKLATSQFGDKSV